MVNNSLEKFKFFSFQICLSHFILHQSKPFSCTSQVRVGMIEKGGFLINYFEYQGLLRHFKLENRMMIPAYIFIKRKDGAMRNEFYIFYERCCEIGSNALRNVS